MADRGGLFINIAGQVQNRLLEGLTRLRVSLDELAETAKETGNIKISSGIKQVAKDAQGLYTIVNESVDGIKSAIKQSEEEAKGAADSVSSSVRKAASDSASSLQEMEDAASDYAEGVGSSTKKMASEVSGAYKKVKKSQEELGKGEAFKESAEAAKFYERILEKLKGVSEDSEAASQEAHRRAKELTDQVIRLWRALSESGAIGETQQTLEAFMEEVEASKLGVLELTGELKKTANGFKIYTDNAREALNLSPEQLQKLNQYIERTEDQVGELVSELNRLRATDLEDLDTIGLRKFKEEAQELKRTLKKLKPQIIQSEGEGKYDELIDQLTGVITNYEDYLGILKDFDKQRKAEEKTNEKVQNTYEKLGRIIERLKEKIEGKELFDSEDLRVFNKELSVAEALLRNIEDNIPTEAYQEYQENLSEISREFKNLRGAADKAMDSLGPDQQEALRELAREFGEGAGNVNRFKRAIREVDEFRQAQMNQITMNIRKLEEEGDQTGKNAEKIKALRREYDKLADKSDLVNDARERFLEIDMGLSKSYSKFNKSLLRTTGNLGMLGDAFVHVGRRVKQFGTFIAAAAIIGGITVAIRELIQVISQFDQALYNLQAIIEITNSQAKVLGETIKDVSRATKFSATEVAEGVQTLGQAGMTMMQSIMAIEGVATLATGTLSNFGQTADLVTTTINAFNLAATEATRVADVFANAINNSKLTVDKLATAFNYVGAAGKQAGLTLNQLTGTLMTLADNGLRASTMGTGLRRMMLQMIDVNTDLARDLEVLGMRVDQLNPKLVGWNEALRNLTPLLWDSRRETVNMAKATEYFGTRAAQVAAVLVRNVSNGSRALEEAVDKTFEFGSASEMAATQEQGLALMMKNLQDRIKLVAVALGEAGLTGIVKDFVGALQESTSAVEEFISSHEKLVQLMGAFTAISTVSLLFAGMVPVVMKLSRQIMKLGYRYGALMGKVGAISAVATATMMVIDHLADRFYAASESALEHAEKMNVAAKAAQKWEKALRNTYGSREWENTIKRFKQQNSEIAESVEEKLGKPIEEVTGPQGLQKLQQAFDEVTTEKLNVRIEDSVESLNEIEKSLIQFVTLTGQELPESMDELHGGFDKINNALSIFGITLSSIMNKLRNIPGIFMLVAKITEVFSPDKEKQIAKFKEGVNSLADSIKDLADHKNYDLDELRDEIERTVNVMGLNAEAAEHFMQVIAEHRFRDVTSQLHEFAAELREVQTGLKDGSITLEEGKKKLEGFGFSLENIDTSNAQKMIKDLAPIIENFNDLQDETVEELIKVLNGEKELADVMEMLRGELDLTEEGFKKLSTALEHASMVASMQGVDAFQNFLKSMKNISPELAKEYDKLTDVQKAALYDQMGEVRKAGNELRNMYETALKMPIHKALEEISMGKLTSDYVKKKFSEAGFEIKTLSEAIQNIKGEEKKKLQEVINEIRGIEEEGLEKFKDKVDQYSDFYDSIYSDRRETVNTYYDWERQKIENTVDNEIQAQKKILQLEKERRDATIRVAQEENREYVESIKNRVKEARDIYKDDSEKLKEVATKATDEITESYENMNQKREEALRSWREELTSAYQFATDKERDYADEIEELQEEIADIRKEEAESLRSAAQTAEEAIQSIERSTMDREELAEDKLEKAYEKSRLADKLMSDATEESTKRAAELQREIISIYEELGQASGEGEQAAVNQAHAISMIRHHEDELTKAIKKNADVQEEAKQEAIEKKKEQIKSLEEWTDILESRVNKVDDKLSNLNELQMKNKKFIINSNVVDQKNSVEDLINYLKDKLHDQTFSYTVLEKRKTDYTGATYGSTGGIVTESGIQYKQEGGLIQNIKDRLRGMFAKGSDTVPAMLSPGEFVMNKKAVDTFGKDFFNMLNKGKMSGGTQAVEEFATLYLNSGKKSYPTKMNKNDLRDLVKELKRQGLSIA